MNSNCDNLCNFSLVLLGLVIVLMCLKYYYTHRKLENFESPMESLEHPHKSTRYFDPCSPDNFKEHLYHFYKAADKYRGVEKELNDARTLYEDKYKEFRDQQHVLDKYKHSLNNCINKT